MGRPPAEIRIELTRSGRYRIGYREEVDRWHMSPETSRPKALAWARRMKATILAESASIRLRDLATGFYDPGGGWANREREKGRSLGERSLLNRAGHLENYLLPEFGNDDPRALLGRDIDDRLRALCKPSGEPLAPGTKRKIAESLSLIFDDLVERGIMPANPLARVRKFSKRPVQARGIISASDLARLFPPSHGALVRVWASTPAGGALWGSLMLVLGDSGMRPLEVARLRWRDLVREEEEGEELWALVFEGAKGGGVRAVGISPRTAQELAIWRAESRFPEDGDHIFTFSGAPVDDASILKAFRRGLSNAGVEGDFTPYSLRHSFVTGALASLSDAEVALLAGHSVQVSRAHYQHPTRDIALARSREARKKLAKSRRIT